ncbi:hypothetical protein ABIH81_11555 [Micromonospora sp. HUAS YX12]|uniref:Uncharacterized protein n=1 Tax=Micromonospora sp. HUAS YX12 TaxID=3156396 RepID=A0AAU7R7Z5_9ACTN
MRLHDDKRAVYARFALHTPDLANFLMDPKKSRWAGDPKPEEQIRELTEAIRLCFAQIRMLAPARVVAAAGALLDVALGGKELTRDRLTAAELEFEKVARQDLRVR